MRTFRDDCFLFWYGVTSNLSLEGNVQVKSASHLKVGHNVCIQQNCVIHCGHLEWCRNSGGVVIGDDSCISPNCVIYGCGEKVIIGKKFDCGPGVKIFSSRTDFETRPNKLAGHKFAQVVIGDNVTLFANAVVSPGVRIGNGAVIAANAVVTRDIPDNVFAGGAPAVVIRKLDVDEQCNQRPLGNQ